MPAYYINLASSTERDATIRRNFRDIARVITRVPAVITSDQWYTDAVQKYGLKQQLARNPGMMAALAITMSHLKAIATAFEATSGESDDSPVLIMEDDIRWAV
jgi:GR25 family glycosyltransferase involved in LPS biosynthesis